jgi:hypothetical protein
MAKNPELKAYSGYITQEQEDNLLIYCEKNNITKARAIGLLIDSIDFQTLKAKKSRLETLEIEFLEFKKTILDRLDNITQVKQSESETNETISNNNGFFDEDLEKLIFHWRT